MFPTSGYSHETQYKLYDLQSAVIYLDTTAKREVAVQDGRPSLVHAQLAPIVSSDRGMSACLGELGAPTAVPNTAAAAAAGCRFHVTV